MSRTSCGLVLLSLLVAACSWSVPADPGRNARLHARSSGASPAASWSPDATGFVDDGAARIYVTKCSQCHEPFAPSHAAADEWPRFVRKYGPRAGLFGAERERVLRWLQGNAR